MIRRWRRPEYAVAAALLAAAVMSGSPCAAAGRGLRIADLRGIVALSSPQIAPDAKSIVVVVTRTNFADDTFDRDLDLIDIASHARRTLTYKRKGLADPAFSPTGDRLAFLADSGTGDAAKTQVFVMPMNGGDARPVTNAAEGVEQFAWRPDGTAIAYAAQDAKPKLTGADRFRDGFTVGNAGITATGPARPVHLWLVAAGGGTPRQMTRGDASVATGEAQSTLSWSPDGGSLAFEQTPNAVLNDAIAGRVAVLDVARDVLTLPTANAGYEADPHFSPVGTHLAFIHSAGDTQITSTDAFVIATGRPNTATDVSRAFDRAVQQTAWTPDGSALLFVCHDGTTDAIVRAPLGGTLERIGLGDLTITSQLAGALAPDGGFAFVGTSTNRPAEVYFRPAGGTPERLTDYNAATAALATATSESVSFSTSNGMHGDAVLTKPAGFTPGTKYPLVLLIHGGPTSSSTTGFNRMAQLMAARGWLVLEPNYRGSDNLGLAYQRSVFHDPEDGPGKDIMAAVDAVRARGIVDDGRIAVGGWSYGGIMTAWLATHYHVWRAAVSGASVNDWITDYSVADDLASDKALFSGSPFVAGNRAEWLRASAVTYVKDVTTPLLILSDNGDNRDPIATSYIFFRALKDNGKDVTFFAYPVAGHFPSDPVRTSDIYDRWITYIGAHFKR